MRTFISFLMCGVALAGLASFYLLLDWIIGITPAMALTMTAGVGLFGWLFERRTRRESVPESDAERRSRMRNSLKRLDRVLDRIDRERKALVAERARVATALIKQEPRSTYRTSAKFEEFA